MKFIVYLIFAIFIKSSKPKPNCMLIKSTYGLKTLLNLIMIIFLCNAFFQFFILSEIVIYHENNKKFIVLKFLLDIYLFVGRAIERSRLIQKYVAVAS